MASAGNDLCYLTIRQAGELFRRGELSAVELIRAHLDRIEDIDGQIHSYVLVTKDKALADARSAAPRWIRPVRLPAFLTGGVRRRNCSRRTRRTAAR